MKDSYLDYYKTILKKVRFDTSLTEKEYHKAFKFIPCDKHEEFANWAKRNIFN